MLDVDHFMGINDTYGHDAGDVVLKTVVGKIISMVRSSDSVVRYGGDEFIILFENLKPDMLFEKLDEIRQAVSELTFVGYPDIKTSISMGGVFCKSSNKLTLKMADEKLYEAKQERNKVCC